MKRWWRRQCLRAAFYAGMPTRFTRPDWRGVDRLVFVCLANLNRSPLAQALCEQAGLHTASCGLYTVTGSRCFSATVRVAAGMGVRLERHRATHWLDFEHRRSDLYLVMEPRHAEHLLRRGVPARRIALLGHWAQPRRLSISDPHLQSERDLRRCFALIRTAVVGLVGELQALHGALQRPAPGESPQGAGGPADGGKPGRAVGWT